MYQREAADLRVSARPAARGSTGSRAAEREREVDVRPSARSAEARGASARGRPSPGAGTEGLRGMVAVLIVFLVTLAGGAVDSYVGVGLGLITLGALAASAFLAALLVRRGDLVSVVVAPPLIFAAVAGANIVLAPSATFSLPTIATLLIRGFPAMAIATAAALVVALFRWAARR